MIVKECSNAIDSKGRFYVPKEYREDFKGKVTVFRFRNYFHFLTEKEWNQLLTKKLSGLKGKEFQMRKRYLWSSASVKKNRYIWKGIYPFRGERKEKI